MTPADDWGDVIVVGAGGSGLAAAVAAAEGGLRVTVIERRSRAGGTTELSVGSMTAAGTSLQARRGIRDDAADLVEDMLQFDPDLLTGDAPSLRELYARESAATLEWLRHHGVAFSGPYPEAPHRVPRMHNVIPRSGTYISRLSEACRRLDVRIITDAEATRLLVEDDAVVGVAATIAGRAVELRARAGVVLASGDFSGNAGMRGHYLAPDAAAAVPINPGSLGAGHRLAEAVGAELLAMNRVFGPQLRFPPPPRRTLIELLPTWRWFCAVQAMVVNAVPARMLRPIVKSLLVSHMSPSDALFRRGAIMVDSTGERVGDESSPASSLASSPEGRGFILLDESIARVFEHAPNHISTAPGIAFAYFRDYRRGRRDLVTRADSAQELAARIGADAPRLESAIAGSGLRAPFVAMGPVLSTLTVTEGGVAVDDELRVLRPDGTLIDGLRAVGGTGQGGLLLLGHGHHIGWAMISGRTAGSALARHWARAETR